MHNNYRNRKYTLDTHSYQPAGYLLQHLDLQLYELVHLKLNTYNKRC